MAERARTGLGRALVDRDHAVLRDHECHEIGNGVAAGFRRDIADALGGDVVCLKRGFNLGLRGRQAAIECMRHRCAARAAGQMREQPGRADGDAGIAGHRRHPEMQARACAAGSLQTTPHRNVRAGACCRPR